MRQGSGAVKQLYDLMAWGPVKVLRDRYKFLATYLGSLLTLAIGFLGHTVGFVILARSLPSSDIGKLAMMTAASTLGAVWCELGVSEMARRRVGRDAAEYPDVLGHSLMSIFGIGTVISLFLITLVAISFNIAPTFSQSFELAALIIPCNVMLFVFIGFAEQMANARGNLLYANYINAGHGLARATVTAVACFGFGVSSLAQWAPWYFAFYVIVSIACSIALWQYGAPRWTIMRDELLRGATMSIWGCLHALRMNIDLLALSTVATPEFIGNYSVARRVLGSAAMVGQGLDRVVYSRLVVVGREGVGAATTLVKKYAVYLTGPLIAASVATFIAASFIPFVFGAKYGEAVYIARVLCSIVVAWGFQNLAFDALNASEQHFVRLLVSIAAACMGCALIVVGTYLYGVNGTLGGVVAGEHVIAVALWIALIQLARRAR